MGEGSWTIRHISAGSDAALRVVGETVSIKASAEDTSGSYSVLEVRMEAGAGPPPCIDHRADHSIYVLEGEFEVDDLDDGRTERAGPGSFLVVPRGVLRGIRNVGRVAGRFLLIVSPGGLERFLAELAESGIAPAALSSPLSVGDAARVAAIGRRYHLEFAVPAPSSLPSSG